MDRVAEIELRWAEHARRYHADVAANRNQMLPIDEVVSDVRFLIDRARENGLATGKEADRLANLDTEFQEFEQSSLRAIDAKKRVPFGIQRLVGIFSFLARLAKSPEPAAA